MDARRVGAWAALGCAALSLAGCMEFPTSTQGQPRPRDEMYAGRDDGEARDRRGRPITNPLDDDDEPRSNSGIRIKQKRRPGEEMAEAANHEEYDRIVDNNTRRMPSSIRTDLSYWQKEAAKREDQVGEYQIRVANDDETLRQLKRKREEAALMVAHLEDLGSSMGLAVAEQPPAMGYGAGRRTEDFEYAGAGAVPSGIPSLAVRPNEFVPGAPPPPPAVVTRPQTASTAPPTPAAAPPSAGTDPLGRAMASAYPEIATGRLPSASDWITTTED